MRLEDICTVFTDGDWIESKDQSESGIRLVQTGNIGEGTYLEKEARAKYISEGTFDKLKCTEIFQEIFWFRDCQNQLEEHVLSLRRQNV